MNKSSKQHNWLNHDFRTLLMRGIIVLSSLVMLSDTLALATGIDQFKYMDELLLVLLSVLALFFVVVRRSVIVKPFVFIATVGVFTFGLLSSLQQSVPSGMMFTGALLMLKPFLFFLALANLPWQEKDLRFMFWFYNWVMVGIVVIGVLDFLLPQYVRAVFPPLEFDMRGGLTSVKSVFTNQGIYSIFTAFYALYFWTKYWQTRRWTYLFLFLLVFILGPFISLRRKAVVAVSCIIALCAVWDILHARIRKTILFVGIGAIIFGTVVAQSVVGAWVERLSFDFIQHPERNARLMLTITSGSIAQDFFPLGGGWGRYGGEVSREEYSPLYYKYGLSDIRGLSPTDTSFVTDTFWPWILGETGVFGLLSYGVGLGYIGWALWRRYRQYTSHSTWYLFGFFIILETVGESIAQQIYGHFTAFYIFGLAAVLLALPLPSSTKNQQLQRKRTSTR